jgi:GNAT superfamily N-acetyltransferase
MEDYKIITDCHDNPVHRSLFYDFICRVYPGLDFRTWHDKGFWPDEYIPHSIVDNNLIVANVSITKMKLLIDGKPADGIQIGTVGTIPEYRGRGLSGYLMNHVLERYKDMTELIFLFANEDVIDFYPQFGFIKYNEVIYISESAIPKSNYSARKLNINLPSDLEIVTDLLRDRLILTRFFGARDYVPITMWHIINIFPDKLHYLEDDNIIFITSEEKERTHIWDIIFKKPFDFSSAVSRVKKSDTIKFIYYYFSPDQLNYKYDTVQSCLDSPLFVRGSFPIGDRFFKFPVTAQT